MVRLYKKVEKLPRIFVASVVVSKDLPRRRLLQIENRMEKLKIKLLYCPA